MVNQGITSALSAQEQAIVDGKKVLHGTVAYSLLYLADADAVMQHLKQGMAQWLQDPEALAWRQRMVAVALTPSTQHSSQQQQDVIETLLNELKIKH